MSERYIIAKDVGPKDWRALPKEFKVGEVIYRYSGHDYGCARDDTIYLKRACISCSVDGKIPFFTVPVEFLLTEDGKHPSSEYLVGGKL